MFLLEQNGAKPLTHKPCEPRLLFRNSTFRKQCMSALETANMELIAGIEQAQASLVVVAPVDRAAETATPQLSPQLSFDGDTPTEIALFAECVFNPDDVVEVR